MGGFSTSLSAAQVPSAVNLPSRSSDGSQPCSQVPCLGSGREPVVRVYFFFSPVGGEQQKDPSQPLLIPAFTASFALPNSLGFQETPMRSLCGTVSFLADNGPWLQNLIRLICLASF